MSKGDSNVEPSTRVSTIPFAFEVAAFDAGHVIRAEGSAASLRLKNVATYYGQDQNCEQYC